jgi:hypothetical protein
MSGSVNNIVQLRIGSKACFSEKCEVYSGSIILGNILTGWVTINFSRKAFYPALMKLILTERQRIIWFKIRLKFCWNFRHCPITKFQLVIANISVGHKFREWLKCFYLIFCLIKFHSKMSRSISYSLAVAGGWMSVKLGKLLHILGNCLTM